MYIAVNALVSPNMLQDKECIRVSYLEIPSFDGIRREVVEFCWKHELPILPTLRASDLRIYA